MPLFRMIGAFPDGAPAGVMICPHLLVGILRRSCPIVEKEAAVHLFSQRMPEDILASEL